MSQATVDLSYFPGCSLATTAKENDLSLHSFCRRIGYNLISLDDWNCCGSSSVYGLEPQAAFHLSSRNISLAPAGRPLLVACPKCLLRLRQVFNKLRGDEDARLMYQRTWGKPFDEKLEILSVFDLLEDRNFKEILEINGMAGLKGIKFVPYYGCMLNYPPDMRGEKSCYGQMEKVLSSLGAEPVYWAYASRCCGTFLSVTRPEIASSSINEIVSDACDSGADCIVTACAMCHLNLEMRHDLPEALPVLHFSEILALAFDSEADRKWFSRHLVDPRPMLKTYGLVAA